jgi:1D-myo-inositol-tetrakisphosphate 5-kinase/inositol-polyphosphate multikinase
MMDVTDGAAISKSIAASAQLEEKLRPWRKRTIQIITTELFRDVEEIKPIAQVAGHGSADAKQAILTGKNGCILKPIQEGPRGVREKKFYADVFSGKEDVNQKFQKVMPKYYGTCIKKVGDKGERKEFLMIENLTHGYEKPCIMDVKIGVKTYGPDASQSKMDKQNSYYKGTRDPFGFCVLGLSSFHGDEKDEPIVKDKKYGEFLNQENIEDFLHNYLDFNTFPENSKVLAKLFSSKLSTLLELFESQSTYHLYGSSILFVYDSVAAIKFHKGEIDEEKLASVVNVTMIDFAHECDGEGNKDSNYLTGIQHLHRIVTSFSD